MPLEIERKFIVTGEFKSLAASVTHIQQGYIVSGKGRTVRIRIRDEKGYLTIKGPSANGGIARYEFEKEITLQEAQELMHLCEPGVIDKHRYLVPASDGHVWEVDEFHGDNDGLIMAELEMDSEDETFILPPFIGKEVTSDRRFYNSHMRTNPYKLWKNDI